MSEEIKTEAAAQNPEAEGSATPAAPKKKGKRWPIVVGVVALVLVIAGGGFWVWHEQPSFCNAICHTPMDPYLPTYEAEPGQPAVDKWGNEVADAGSMLSAVHRADADATCMSCHIPTIGEQVAEGVGWISGNYYYPLEERDAEHLVAWRGVEADEFCLNEACHNMTRQDLLKATADMSYNPHQPQHGELQCSDCHKAHRASVMTCTKCHDGVDVPNGWLTAQEAEKLQ